MSKETRNKLMLDALDGIHSHLLGSYDFKDKDSLISIGTTMTDHEEDSYHFLTGISFDSEEFGAYEATYHTRFDFDGDIQSYATTLDKGDDFGEPDSSLVEKYSKAWLEMLSLELEVRNSENLVNQSYDFKESKENLSFGTTEKHFKSSSKRAQKELKKIIEKKTGQDVEISLGEAQQFLSHLLFGTNFQDSKANILNNLSHSIHSSDEFIKEDTIDSGVHDVSIVEYSGECMLFVDGVFINSTYVGTDMETPYHVIEREAMFQSNKLCVDIVYKDYNGELWQDWEYEELGGFFNAIGLIGGGSNDIFRDFETADSFRIDGVLVQGYGLVGDWEHQIDFDDVKPDFSDIYIWMPETNKQGAYYEWFFSLESFLEAKKIDEGVWDVDGYQVKILK